MCEEILGHFGVCGHRAVVYIGRCMPAIRNKTICPLNAREQLWDSEEDKDDELCPACKGETRI